MFQLLKLNKFLTGFISFIFIGASITPTSFAASPQALPKLHSGINTFPWFFRAKMAKADDSSFIYPDTFPNRSIFTIDRLAQLHAIGVDFIRIPIDVSPFLAAQRVEDRDALIAQVIQAAILVNKAGMASIVTLHPHEGSRTWNSRAILSTPKILEKYTELLTACAKELSNLEGQVIFEPMNEPSSGYDGGINWFDIQERFVANARRVAPTLPLLLTGDMGGGGPGLRRLNPSRFDKNTYYSFHYYEPMVVTHQGADWGSVPWRRYISGIEYPPVKENEREILDFVRHKIFEGKASDKSKVTMWQAASSSLKDYYEKSFSTQNINEDFDLIAKWAKKYGIPPSRIIVGEFGVLRPGANKQTVINYAKDVRSAAEANGFAWAYYNYTPQDDEKGGFSLLTMTGPDPSRFDRQILEEGLGWHMRALQ